VVDLMIFSRPGRISQTSLPFIQTTNAVRLLFDGRELFEAIRIPILHCHFSANSKSRGQFLNLRLLYSLAFFPQRPRLNVFSSMLASCGKNSRFSQSLFGCCLYSLFPSFLSPQLPSDGLFCHTAWTGASTIIVGENHFWSTVPVLGRTDRDHRLLSRDSAVRFDDDAHAVLDLNRLFAHA
jgi:hypothetical protein